jgi:hypothetical protein
MSILKQLHKYLQTHTLFRRIFYSFFFRLILLDLKKNQSLLVFWVIFFGIITDNVATRYGVSYLFLGPEYMDNISFLSYFITGFACGGFIMAYNISSYVKNAFRFPFLATLKNPFFKYCLNNFALPLSFLTLYIVRIFFFLKGEGNMNFLEIIWMIFAFIFGTAIFLILSFIYSYKTNKDITKLYGIRSSEFEAVKVHTKKIMNGQRNPSLIKESRDWYVETYLLTPFKLRLVRSVRHYKREILRAVIKQNHNAAFVFQITSIVTLLLLGLFSHIAAFEIPAAASIFLLFTMFIMLFCSFYTWLRGWSTVVFILFLVSFNFLHRVVTPSSLNKAYGLNYDTTKAAYNYDQFKLIDKQHYLLNNDINHTLDILKKWKEKNSNPAFPDKKPKLVFINTSGGGLRSALWTFYTMQRIDSLSQGQFMKNIQLITGSSGGMVGASYIRELYLLKQKNNDVNYYSEVYLNNMSRDLLNPIAFNIATTEWFFPLKRFTVDNNSYSQDRGYSFEEKLEQNTNNVFNKRLGDYREPESNSTIPMMVFSPSIVNDGRKLLISPIGISYLTQNSKTEKVSYNKLYDAVDFSRLFEMQGAAKTLFTSVLRMSATFPYISPIVSLPSEPRIEIMDAGLRDNYGLETTLRFVKTFNEWIANNTSGVVIIQIRDKHKNVPIDANPSQTLMEALSRPMGSFYSSLFEVQDFNQNQQIQMADAWSKSKIEIFDLQLRNERTDKISLSWHLTNKEKKKVLRSIDLPENQQAIIKIVELLK